MQGRLGYTLCTLLKSYAEVGGICTTLPRMVVVTKLANRPFTITNYDIIGGILEQNPPCHVMYIIDSETVFVTAEVILMKIWLVNSS